MPAPALIGHAAAQEAFLSAWTSGRIHHAWLLAGPQGVGKRTFADAAAAMVLAGARDWSVPADHPSARLLAAGAHPDLEVISRPLRRDGALGKEILVLQLRGGVPDSRSLLEPVNFRGLGRLLHTSAALAEWRVVIIDAADDLNITAANAFLKNLEEPPPRTLFLLISHAPGRLLPTIRSRCRRLRFSPLSPADTRTVLSTALPDATPAELTELTTLADGAPGRAIAYAGLGVAELIEKLDRLAGATPAEARAITRTLATTLAGKAAQSRYEAFLDLAPRALAARARAAGGSPAALLRAWETARDLAACAVPLTLDPASTTTELAALVSRR